MTIIDDALDACWSEKTDNAAIEAFDNIKINPQAARVTAAIIQAQALDRLTKALGGLSGPTEIKLGDIIAHRGGMYASAPSMTTAHAYAAQVKLRFADANGQDAVLTATGPTPSAVCEDMAKKITEWLMPAFSRL